MIALDSDILTDVLRGRADYLARVAVIPSEELALPAVVAAEAIRGWLDAVRQAEAGRGGRTLPVAYDSFVKTVGEISRFPILPYTAAADAQYKAWRAAKIGKPGNDLRIAAICHSAAATLVTRNARDYALVPGLALELWN